MSGVNRVVFMLDGCVHCEPLSSAWDHLPRYVLASDYDRDTEALKDELDNIKRSWGLLHSERNELLARVEAMRIELNEVLAMYPFRLDRQSFVINGGAALCADGDDEFYSAKKINEVLGNIRACINAALQESKPC